MSRIVQTSGHLGGWPRIDGTRLGTRMLDDQVSAEEGESEDLSQAIQKVADWYEVSWDDVFEAVAYERVLSLRHAFLVVGHAAKRLLWMVLDEGVYFFKGED